MGIDINLLKSCTLANNKCRVVCRTTREAVWEAIRMTTRGGVCGDTREVIHRAAREAMQISTSSSHLIQTN